MRVVLDASVAVKWLLPEADSEKAQDVLLDWNAGRLELVVPGLLLAEVANVLWKKAGKREIGPS
ncbi:MAG TPA: type II toxin-antitoxin system VapC family toxin [Terriglobia bacterium]|nr:type II toxin-antitoxin system VapC family toxin [Terriglobia bacterium]